MKDIEYIVIRDLATDELRVTRVMLGYRPPCDPAYTWGGPFGTRQRASKAIAEKSGTLRRQLYPQ